MANGVIKKKICLLGAFAVGKTSLIEREVRGIFSEKYLTTVGVKIDKKQMRVKGKDLLLLIWDTEGTNTHLDVRSSYLKGMSGYLLVGDGTRPLTVEACLQFREQVEEEFGKIPCVLLVNKVDLVQEWKVAKSDIAETFGKATVVFYTSAKTGEEVAKGFEALSRMLVDGGDGTS
jgi:small GTP-binding protein